MSLLKLQVIGNLVKDAEQKNVAGKTVINFTVAQNEKRKDKDGQTVNKATYVDCGYWTDRLAIVPYLKKGTQVYVEGIPDVRPYEGKDGKPAASLTVRVSQVQLIGGGNPTHSSAQPINTPATEPVDDLPF